VLRGAQTGRRELTEQSYVRDFEIILSRYAAYRLRVVTGIVKGPFGLSQEVGR
jgi:hypothetical protein